jgi:pantoate--beta-alanine ligase
MKVLRGVEEMRAACKAADREQMTIGLVPTMGALHEGHLSLVRAARASCDFVVATIFVNPTQFGPGEDFAAYPRTFEADCEMLERENVDLLFAPVSEAMYPAGAETFVDAPEVGGRLDGASRPGHFRGVATVVTKLLHIVQPDRAFFGQKDAAQVAVLRTMVRDLNFGVEVVVCPTVRDEDGLALSSRNKYLSAEERSQAMALGQSLRLVETMAAAGEANASTLVEAMRTQLDVSNGVHVDYAVIVNKDTLLPVIDVHDGALVAVAARIGKTRLIDNVVLAGRG